MSATLHPSAHIGRRVVIVTKGDIVYGAAGKLHVQSVDEAGGITLALPKGAPAAYIPARNVKTLTVIPD